MPNIKQRGTLDRPYTDDTWCFIILSVGEFVSPDLDSYLVDVNGAMVPYGEVRRRNRDKDWARFNSEGAL